MPAKKKETVTPEEAVAAYQANLKNKLNAKYASLAKRLESEPNIILRYEIKLSTELLIDIYKDLFPEGK